MERSPDGLDDRRDELLMFIVNCYGIPIPLSRVEPHENPMRAFPATPIFNNAISMQDPQQFPVTKRPVYHATSRTSNPRIGLDVFSLNRLAFPVKYIRQYSGGASRNAASSVW
jgi:hypothetical protein